MRLTLSLDLMSARLSMYSDNAFKLGLFGASLSLMDYANESPCFRQEVLPRLEAKDLCVLPPSEAV